jgi:hypothetical protein
MSGFLLFICGIVLGAVVTHLAHEYMDALLPYKRDEEELDPPLWKRGKDEEK